MSGDRRCIVPKCGHTRFTNRELKFYAFPKDPDLKLKWMENLKMKKCLNKLNFVCSIHFEDKMKCESRLKKKAVPTLHLGYNGPVAHEFIEHFIPKRKCCVQSCRRRNLYKNRILFKFTDNEKEIYAWAKACKLPLPLPSKKLYICERHFEEAFFSKVRLFPGAFPKLYLSDEDEEDVEKSDNESNASDTEQSEEDSYAPDLQINPPEEQIRKLNAEIECLRKDILLLENNAIYPQAESSAEALIFARMIVGDEKLDYTDKEKDLAKKLRCNISAIAYRFMNRDIGCRLPQFKTKELMKFKFN
ncbi:unnamed protein product [Ceratitis capitata]|uniref:(Mediterranean fruit fly) hypothetical protein n=1 Tax=Ceratitis capitata TaxID=7213 RepID=A0A811VEB1_CERCA|nr:unnamed protein product [Ceratitis capitata]